MKGKIRLIVPLLLAAGLLAWLLLGRGESTSSTLEVSGTVEATEADLGFGVGGRVEVVAVREGDRVQAGQELARLDRAELEARRDAAAAQLDAARSLLGELRSGARPEERAQAEAAARAAGQRLEDAERDLARARTLHEGGAISRENLEKAETARELAVEAARQAEDQLRLVRAGPRSERVAAQQAAVRQAEAALGQVEAMLDDAVLRAPFAGRVTVRHREPGETVAPGAPVLTVMDPDDRWVRIFVPEDRLGAVFPGQAAAIGADTYPGRSYAGEVSFISDEAEFTPRNVQTPEERVRLVYAVKVRITGDPEMELKPGLPADVRLEEPAPEDGGG